MTTVCSKKSLLVWHRNRNGVQIDETAFGGDVLWLKPMYSGLFRDMSEAVKKNAGGEFVPLWSKKCGEWSDKVVEAVKLALSKQGMQYDETELEKIGAKFKGNAGEIMLQMLVEEGLASFGKAGSYTPVDPDNEQFVDATATRDGLPIGIQMKNYNASRRLESKYFMKAAAMSDLWLRRDKIVPEDQILDFVRTPCQYIVSTVAAENDMVEQNYKSSVVLLGPKWFEKLRICGSVKTAEQPRWRMFKSVADEIDNVLSTDVA